MHLVPQSLSWRLISAVLGGVVLAIATGNYFHHNDRVRLIEGNREHDSIEHFRDVISLLASLPPDLRATAIANLPEDKWRMEEGTHAEESSLNPGNRLSERIQERLGSIAKIESAWMERSTSCDTPQRGCFNSFGIAIKFPDGGSASLTYLPKLFSWPHHGHWIRFRDRDLLVIATMACIGWLVVRLALHPLQKMTQAAESFGRDISHPPIDESGPVEVQRAAQAFNKMQEQIRVYMAERTQILAAVTHDLKTPMTRMRLRLENCADENFRERLGADLTAMQTLVDEGLELAQSLETSEITQLIDLDSLLQSLCDDSAETGIDVDYEGVADQEIIISARPNAIKRVFENIIDNAVNYGHCARIKLAKNKNLASVTIQDQGPGIAEEQMEKVLQPFVRLETSRSRETGGTGLGLAIAANLLKTQQGQITLRNLSPHGLEVRIELPLAPLPN